MAQMDHWVMAGSGLTSRPLPHDVVAVSLFPLSAAQPRVVIENWQDQQQTVQSLSLTSP